MRGGEGRRGGWGEISDGFDLFLIVFTCELRGVQSRK